MLPVLISSPQMKSFGLAVVGCEKAVEKRQRRLDTAIQAASRTRGKENSLSADGLNIARVKEMMRKRACGLSCVDVCFFKNDGGNKQHVQHRTGGLVVK